MFDAHNQACLAMASRFMSEFPEMSRLDVTRLLSMDQATINAVVTAMRDLDSLERECLLAKLPTLIKRTRRNRS